MTTFTVLHTHTHARTLDWIVCIIFFNWNYLACTVVFLLECISVKKGKCPVQQKTINSFYYFHNDISNYYVLKPVGIVGEKNKWFTSRFTIFPVIQFFKIWTLESLFS